MSAPGTIVSAITHPNIGEVSTLTTCEQLLIRIPGVASDKIAYLRCTSPAGTPVGTALFLSGGKGGDAYSAPASVGGMEMMQAALAANYQVLELWYQGGWYANGQSLKLMAGRCATAFEWIRDNRASASMVGVGNSGGSDQLARALASHGAGDWLQRAVLCSGPPVTDMTVACVSPVPPAWTTSATLRMTIAGFDPTQYSLTGATGSFACQACQGKGPGMLAEDNVLHTGAVTNYPTTDLRYVLGRMDTVNQTPNGSMCVPQSLLHQELVTAQTKTLTIVEDGVHFMPTTQAGRDAILEAMAS